VKRSRFPDRGERVLGRVAGCPAMADAQDGGYCCLPSSRGVRGAFF
jgi:hypothetical protein